MHTGAVDIHTIGYEGLGPAEFLAQLRRTDVALVVDVRDVPMSRKRGFSKTALSEALRGAGFEYLHCRSLGCPKTIRDRYRADRDWEAYTAAFMQHLSTQASAVRELAGLCESRAAALLCFEADAWRCHRTYVARAVAARSGGRVLHIGAAGIAPDREPPAAEVIHRRRGTR